MKNAKNTEKACKTCTRLLVDDLGYYCNAEKKWIDKTPPCGETLPKWTDLENPEELPSKMVENTMALAGVLIGFVISFFLYVAYVALSTLWPK